MAELRPRKRVLRWSVVVVTLLLAAFVWLAVDRYRRTFLDAALIGAIENYSPGLARDAVETGANVNCRVITGMPQPALIEWFSRLVGAAEAPSHFWTGVPVLSIAAFHSGTESVRMLFEHGADPRIPDLAGNRFAQGGDRARSGGSHWRSGKGRRSRQHSRLWRRYSTSTRVRANARLRARSVQYLHH